MSVSERIKAITAQGIAYAREHEAEIKQAQEASKRHNAELTKRVMRAAESAKKGDYNTYEYFKNALPVKNDENLRRLAEILKV